MSKQNQQIQQSKIEQLFTLVKNENKKIIIAVGNYRVSRKEFDTFSQAEQYIGSKPYELIFNTTCLLIEQNSKQNETQNKTEEEPKSC